MGYFSIHDHQKDLHYHSGRFLEPKKVVFLDTFIGL